jgi:hypothetical protein
MDLAVETPARCSVYRRHRPERTALYRAVQGHLETYLALARDGHDDGEGVPRYVEGEFRRYLECGILAHGFARVRCGGCGHDFLIAFSCKGRALCPSCNARHMVETAAHLVDQVFPPLPVRQWVLAVPKRLRYFLNRDPEALGAVLHIVLRVIEARLRQRSGCPGGRLGAVSFVQRFGSALNAHVHFHCCVIDGVFAVGEGEQVQFCEAGAPTPEELAAVQQQVRGACCAGSPAPALSTQPMRATWPAGTTAGASRWMPRCASRAPTAPGWSACCATARARRLRWSASSSSATTNWSIAPPSPSPTGAPSCASRPWN